MLFPLDKRFSRKAKLALEKTCLYSKQKDWHKIDGVFLLKTLLENERSLGGLILKKYFTSKKILPEKISYSLFRVTQEAIHLAAFSKSSYIGTEHLANSLIVLLEKSFISTAKKKFTSANKNSLPEEDIVFSEPSSFQPDFLSNLNVLINNFFTNKNSEEKSLQHLEKFCINLNDRVAQENYFLIGRENEIQRIMHILARRQKNNPVLVGEPGVGKTAIVEGLAEKINHHSAGTLNNKKILSLDLGLLLAGTNFRGEFESRLKDLILQIQKNRDFILFIDEIHTLVGAGNAVGGMDAANILKPALSRGDIQVIGATTSDEYYKYIAKDAALERRFQPIFIKEPSQKESCIILEGIKKFYEDHHHLKIPSSLLPEIVRLAKEYLPERFLPDSAIDILDEASALRHSLIGNNDLYQKISQAKTELKKLIQQKEFLVINERYEEATKVRQEEKKVEHNLKLLNKKLQLSENKQDVLLQKEDIWQIVSRSAQIPLELLTQKKHSLPIQIKEHLEKNLIGQKEVIEKIYQTLLRQFSGLATNQKPLGSFFFIGGAGVGKTLTAQLLAQKISPLGRENLLQINMSELAENHSVSRLLGAPAGYVGYEESGELTEKIRHNPYCVVLFDEVEKAGTAALNLLLKILEEGRLTDAKGKLIDFRRAIIILTSNFATEQLNKVAPIGFSSVSKTSAKKTFRETKKAILNEVTDFFPKELLDRLDHLLVFNNLTAKDLKKIAQKELEQLEKRLKKSGWSWQIADNVPVWIVQKSLSKQPGARIIKQIVQNEIEPLLADFLLKNSSDKKPKKLRLEINSQKKLSLKNCFSSKKSKSGSKI